MKRHLVISLSAAVCAAALSCRQDPALDALGAAPAGAERKGGSQFHDGTYIFYGRYSGRVVNKCDGYDFTENGTSRIYEYWRRDNAAWVGRLAGLGITVTDKHQTRRTGKYCWVEFASSGLIGIGHPSDPIFPDDNSVYLRTLAHSDRLNTHKFTNVTGLYYAREEEYMGDQECGGPDSIAYTKRADPTLLLVYHQNKKKDLDRAVAYITDRLRIDGSKPAALSSGADSVTDSGSFYYSDGIIRIYALEYQYPYYFLLLDAHQIRWFMLDDE